MGEGLLAHVIDAVRRSAVQRSPFAHAYLERVWPVDLYATMLESLPPAAQYRDDGRECRQVLPLDAETPIDAPWDTIRDVLTSEELHAAVCAHFGLRARRSDGRLVSSSRPILVRDLPGYWIEPHPDSRAKHITMQLYLPADTSQSALGTTLYQLRPFRPSTWRGRTPFMQPVHRFPFTPNTGYIFPVGWRSFHGVEPVASDAGIRHTLMNTYYWNGR